MQFEKCVLYTFFAFVFVFTSQAMAGEWTDEFEEEDEIAKNWTPLFGTWTFIEGIYKMQAGAVCGAAITEFDSSDAASIEIKARYVNGGWENYSIILAYVDEDEAYQFDLRGGGETARFERFTPGVAGAQVLTQGNQVSDFNEWYTLKVVVEGDSVIGLVDDKEIARYTFPQGLPKGKIGLGGEQSITEFEYITITGPRIGVKAVESVAKLTTTWAGIKAQD